MAKFSEDRKRRADTKGSERCLPVPVQLTGLMSLAEVLCGYERTPGEFVEGCSITVWVADGFVKCCINDKETCESGFFTLRQPSALGDAMEEELEAGAVEWKKKPAENRRR
jgi:hypothetical protein